MCHEEMCPKEACYEEPCLDQDSGELCLRNKSQDLHQLLLRDGTKVTLILVCLLT